MRIGIDAFDGKGVVDYTGAMLPGGPITVRRTLNAPSTCSVDRAPEAIALPVPPRRARVVVTAEDGATLFTG